MSTTTRTDRPQQAATRWRLDPQASSAEFRVPSLWGLSTVRGRFGRLDGYLDIDADGGQRRMHLAIEANSLDTGNRRRDEHLRSADFFDCERHPQVRFSSADVSDLGDGRLGVDGELDAGGHRVHVELEPTVRETEDRLELHAEATVDQRELGMTVSRFGIKAPATLTVHACLRRSPSPAGSGAAS